MQGLRQPCRLWVRLETAAGQLTVWSWALAVGLAPLVNGFHHRWLPVPPARPAG